VTRVLLVSCYELGEQPLGLAGPADALQRAGHDVRTADLSVEDWPSGHVEWCEAVGFSVPMHTALRLALSGLERVRAERPGVPAALYGLYAHVGAELGVVLPGDLAASDDIEDALVGFANRVGAPAATGRPARPASGTDAAGRVRSELLLPLDRYARLLTGGTERLVGAIDATEGCNHRCRHCPVPVVFNGRSRPVELDAVLHGVDELVELGAGHIHFGDPDFLNRPPHALRVARALHDAHPGLSFDATIKVSHLLRHRASIAELAELGLVFVVSAFESTSDVVLDRLDKGHRAADLDTAVSILRAVGVEPRPSLLPFTPWTTRADLLRLLDFVVAADLVPNVDPVQYGIRLLLPPGSLLLANPDPVLEGAVVGYDPSTLGYAWRSPDGLLDELATELGLLTERAALAGEAIEATYWAVRQRCYDALGAEDPGLPPVTAPPGPAADLRPRLTESWFCCAEPTSAQINRLGTTGPEAVEVAMPVRLRRG